MTLPPDPIVPLSCCGSLTDRQIIVAKMKKAPLIGEIPPNRFRTIDGSVPQVGDIVVLDQGLTFPDGEPGCIVYGLGKDGNFRWEAEVYESEIGPDLPSN